MDPRLAALAAAQGGVFSAAQARAHGYSSAEMQELRERGQWTAVRRGTYCESGLYAGLQDPALHRLRARALLLTLHRPTVLSHVTAGAWLELDMLVPDFALLHVTRGELHSSRREADVKHHAASLPPEHLIQHDGVVVTAPARTAVDIAWERPLAQGVAVVDSVLRRWVDPAQLRAVLEQCAYWPGARTASRAVALGDGRAANPGESWSRVVLAELGLMPTHLQYPVNDEDGLAGIADFCWEDEGVLGEFDGLGKYKVPPGADPEEAAGIVAREKLREDRLRDLGFEVVRWVWADLHRPQVLRARVLRAMDRAAAGRRRAS